MELLTTQQVADMLQVNAGTLAYWRHINQGPKSFKVGRHVRYARADVEEYINEQKRNAEMKGSASHGNGDHK